MSRRWKALLLAVVPGLGHLYLGRHWRGLLVFALFALAVNGMFLSPALPHVETGFYVFYLCRGAALAVWLYSIFHVASMCRHFESRPARERKDYHFKRGLTQYLAGTFDRALAEFQAVLRLDPGDVDARFHLAMTHRALGQNRRATKAFRRCLADDLDAKWKWEIEEQLRDLRQTKQGDRDG